MKWILVFVLYNNSSGDIASITTEFTTKEKCMAAATVLAKDSKRRDPYSNVVTLSCLEK